MRWVGEWQFQKKYSSKRVNTLIAIAQAIPGGMQHYVYVNTI